ncbi:MAG TPA: RnfH family protein [Rhizobacter sp.]|nr:RnfH family protein [Rhizobacter sp.]
MLNIAVAYSPSAATVRQVSMQLPEGTTVLQALHQSQLLVLFPEIDLKRSRIGVWGKLKALDAELRDRDRVEIYRPLHVDPKEARRQRQRSRQER